MNDAPFFEPLPEPEAPVDEEEQVFDLPWLPPSHIAGVTAPLDVDVFRSDDVAVRVTHAVCYRRGFELHVSVWVRPGGSPKEPSRPGRWHDEMPRVGVRLADGTKLGSEAVDGGQLPDDDVDADGGADHMTLTPMGGGSEGTRMSSQWWLHPQPRGDWLEMVALWEFHGMPESAARIDLAPLREAAERETVLWQGLPVPGPGHHGWFAYAPMSGSTFSSQLSITTDTEEQDGGSEPAAT